MIYFISDLHLGHNRILKMERPEFISIQEHDDFIRRSIEHQVHKDDVLWVLGDVSLGGDFEWLKNVGKERYLITGNHDRAHPSKYKNVFTKVYDHPIYLSSRIILSHQPVKCDDDQINIHGHLHNSVLELPNYVCVSIAVRDYKCLSMKEVMEILSNIPKDKKKWQFTYEWWAPYQIRRGKKNQTCWTEDGHIDIEKERARIAEYRESKERSIILEQPKD